MHHKDIFLRGKERDSTFTIDRLLQEDILIRSDAETYRIIMEGKALNHYQVLFHRKNWKKRKGGRRKPHENTSEQVAIRGFR